jgi:23S rRNA (cytidine1920-2'-O)/16S rRNA (cytidine1409-2'-O)-methyltransferase
VKPQFEADRSDVLRGGVVHDPSVWRRALEDVIAACTASAIEPRGMMASPLLGPAGNVEFLIAARVSGGSEPGSDGDGRTSSTIRADVESAIAEGARLRERT